MVASSNPAGGALKEVINLVFLLTVDNYSVTNSRDVVKRILNIVQVCNIACEDALTPIHHYNPRCQIHVVQVTYNETSKKAYEMYERKIEQLQRVLGEPQPDEEYEGEKAGELWEKLKKDMEKIVDYSGFLDGYVILCGENIIVYREYIEDIESVDISERVKIFYVEDSPTSDIIKTVNDIIAIISLRYSYYDNEKRVDELNDAIDYLISHLSEQVSKHENIELKKAREIVERDFATLRFALTHTIYTNKFEEHRKKNFRFLINTLEKYDSQLAESVRKAVGGSDDTEKEGDKED